MQSVFSYPLQVDELTAEPRKYRIKATAEELEYIAEVLKVIKVHNFEAVLMVQLFKKEHLVQVSGRAKAALELTSVISLENFRKTYNPTFVINFDTRLKPQDLQGQEFDLDEEVPDLIIDGKIDLAEIAMEQIALVIDDFPRKEGEVFEFQPEFDEDAPAEANPFAVLAQLKK